MLTYILRSISKYLTCLMSEPGNVTQMYLYLVFCVEQAEAEAVTNGAAETNGTSETARATADGQAATEGEKTKELSHEDQQSEY